VTLRSLLLAAALALTAAGQSPAPPGWTTVPLPFSPFGITARNNTLWVCGTDATIASSSDGAKTWQIHHQEKSGETFTALRFVTDTQGYAVGYGPFYETTDGGNTWHGVDRGMGGDFSALGFTSRGAAVLGLGGDLFVGDTHSAWKQVKIGSPAQLEYVSAIAAADDERFVVLFARQRTSPTQLTLTSSDHGHHWVQRPLPHVSLNSMRVEDHHFIAYGFDSAGARPQPIALVSDTGESWQRLSPPPVPYFACAQEGCLVGSGPWDAVSSWVALSGDATIFYSFPAAVIGGSWAASATEICSVGIDLRCTPTGRRDGPPPFSDKIELYAQLAASKCLHCPEPTPMNGRANVHGTVVIRGLVHQDGSVDHLVVLSTPEQPMAENALRIVSTWRFEPLVVNGVPREFPWVISINY